MMMCLCVWLTKFAREIAKLHYSRNVIRRCVLLLLHHSAIVLQLAISRTLMMFTFILTPPTNEEQVQQILYLNFFSSFFQGTIRHIRLVSFSWVVCLWFSFFFVLKNYLSLPWNEHECHHKGKNSINFLSERKQQSVCWLVAWVAGVAIKALLHFHQHSAHLRYYIYIYDERT